MKIDFSEYLKQRRQSSLKNELVSKALGAKAGLRVLDATAGLCRDAFILASLGYKVTALEKNKTLFKVLEQAYTDACAHPQLQEMMKNLKVINSDFFEFDKDGFDCIYLDPMFPEKKKSALPGKGMQDLQALLKDESVDEAAMLAHALKTGTPRVVLKRPLKSEVFLLPKAQFKGNSIRFDVYVLP